MLIENSYNAGKITCGTSGYGGILGSVNFSTGKSKATINYCHNIGTIEGNENCKGGILGYKQDGVEYESNNNYWLSTCGASYIIGSNTSDTSTGKLTLDQMKVQTNFNNWNFTSIWKIDDIKGYPVFQ